MTDNKSGEPCKSYKPHSQLFIFCDLEKPGTSGGLEGADVWGDQDDVSISN